MELSFYIDELTNSIIDDNTGESFDTDVVLVSTSDFNLILKKNSWKFEWKSESKHADRQLYKLVIKENAVIHGLISIQPNSSFIEMHLIETALHNLGKSKRYFGVAGNLLAFACKMSFDSGFNDVVGFNAKTKLIQHYTDSFGAELIFNNRMNI